MNQATLEQAAAELIEMFGDKLPDPDHCPKLEPTLKNIVHVIYQQTTERSGPWIAGGMGRQIAIGESNFNDIDVWFKDRQQHDKLANKLHDMFGYEMYENLASMAFYRQYVNA